MPLMIRERCLVNYALNFVSAILLILTSKYLFRRYPISAFTLTISNCLFSGLYATIALRFVDSTPTNVSNRPKTSYRTIGSISVIFAVFLLLSNISLQYNTIGTYQIIKSFIPPVLMVIEGIELIIGWNSFAVNQERFWRDYSLPVLGAFVVLIGGTVTTLVFDLNLHLFGLICAGISILFNSLHQTLIQGEASSTVYERTRFLQLQSFLSGALLIPFWPFLDANFTYLRFILFHWQPIFLLSLSGLLAFPINASTLWLIKDDGATGYNMVGLLKSFLIIFFGSALFRERLTLKQLIGLVATIIGSVFYIHVSYRKREWHKQSLSSNAQ